VSEFRTPLYSIASYMGVWISDTPILDLGAHPNESTNSEVKGTCSATTPSKSIDILYTLDSASNYSAIQKLKPWLQSQVVPMKWEDSYVFYFLNRELKH
jgi:hypothetical protein